MQIILDDINKSIKNECYISALALALTLPDICIHAKANNQPEKCEVGRKEYKQWINEFLTNINDKTATYVRINENGNILSVGHLDEKDYAFYSLECKAGEKLIKIIEIDGELLYSLRCSILHAGNTNFTLKVEGKPIEFDTNLGISKLENRNYSHYRILCSSNPIKFSADIDIALLCERLCNAAQLYFNSNTAYFNKPLVIADFDDEAEMNKLFFLAQQ